MGKVFFNKQLTALLESSDFMIICDATIFMIKTAVNFMEICLNFKLLKHLRSEIFLEGRDGLEVGNYFVHSPIASKQLHFAIK